MQTVPQVGWTEPGGREPRGGKIWFAFWRLRLMLENGLQRQGVGAERPPTPGGQGSAWLEPVEHPGSWSSGEGAEPGLGCSALASTPDRVTHCSAPWSGWTTVPL